MTLGGCADIDVRCSLSLFHVVAFPTVIGATSRGSVSGTYSVFSGTRRGAQGTDVPIVDSAQPPYDFLRTTLRVGAKLGPGPWQWDWRECGKLKGHSFDLRLWVECLGLASWRTKSRVRIRVAFGS